MRHRTKLIGLLVSLAVLAAACGGDDDDTTGGESDGVSGDMTISGSSTVEPISVRVAELLADENDQVNVDVDGPGTGDGFKLFCTGETDISDASRPIKADDPEEGGKCEENGIEYIEIEVGIDGMSVMTSTANEDVECLNFPDLYALVGPESQGFENWSDAQDLAAELGSDTEFPDLALDVTAPGAESGTYDSFVEIALADTAEARLEEGKIREDEVETTRKDYTSQSNDDAIIQGIEGSDGSFGWVGFAFAEQAGENIREIPVAAEPGGECVEPTAETIADGSYPLSRTLYIYVNADRAEENPAVAEYVDFYLGDGYSAVEEVGYVALPDDRLEAATTRWDDRTTGTSAEG